MITKERHLNYTRALSIIKTPQKKQSKLTKNANQLIRPTKKTDSGSKQAKNNINQSNILFMTLKNVGIYDIM